VTELIRLIRVSLLLRLIPSLLTFIAVLATGNTSFLLLVAISASASTALLASTWVAQRRGWVTPRHVRWLLVLTIAAYAIEMIAPLLAFRYAMAHHLIPTDAITMFDAQSGVEAQSGRNSPLIFILIPTVLGAWMSGGRGALRWAGFAILINFLGLAFLLIDARSSGQTLAAVNAPFNGFGAFLAQALVIAMVCYFVGSLADRQRAEHAELEKASRLLAEQSFVREQLAVTRERMSLSRDLHDTVAHTLAALSVQMNAVAAVLDGPQPAARREVERARSLVKEGLDSTRQAISGMRNNQVGDLGLCAALRAQADALAERTDLQVIFECSGPEFDLTDEVSNTLFRIGQESLNNVERHSQAHIVHVGLRFNDEQPKTITLVVRDDGTGFDADAILDQDRFGLLGMRERAALIDAHLRVDSAVGQGTTVTMTWRAKG